MPEYPTIPSDSGDNLRALAQQIWQAGVEAVLPQHLLPRHVRREGDHLLIGRTRISLEHLGRICVVGAGKAGAGMAVALEHALGHDLVDEKLTGWVNVPADCLQPTQKIHLHAARPAGVNEPTADGVVGAEQIIERVSSLHENDLCLVLISGGGSALLPLPVAGIELADKQHVTRMLMQRGATIQEMNTVRKQLSAIKGGQLAEASAAGHLISLIISDVVGNPLDVIASGPTVANSTTAADAIEVLTRLIADRNEVPAAVWQVLEEKAKHSTSPSFNAAHVVNEVIGDNQTALLAAAREAERLGYQVHSLGSDNEGQAVDVGRQLAELCRSIRETGQPLKPSVCLLSGGEPIVQLDSTATPGKGGRNQEVALAALTALKETGMSQIAILAGGTDGEDGPTDAAGGLVDATVLQRMREQGLSPEEYLARHDSYDFLEQVDGLLKTGPTQTNVMDLRVALVGLPQ